MAPPQNSVGWIALLAAPALGYVAWRAHKKKHATTTTTPAAAVAELAAAPATWQRVTSSTVADGAVVQAPPALLAQAHAIDPRTTLDELAAARLIASERGDGTVTEWACIVDAELNRAAAAGRSLFDSLTRGHGFGPQGAQRPASTRLDPHEGHLAAARLVIAGEARGIARGAVRFFDPATQDALARGKPARCDALAILTRWSYGYAMRGECVLDTSKPGADNPTQAWVGPIPGVDAWRLMLFAPMAFADPQHVARYQAALAVIQVGRGLAPGKAVS